MDRRLLCAVSSLVFLAAIPASPSAGELPRGTVELPPDTIESRWEGHLAFRGDRWPIRLRVARADGGCSARLDLPALVFAGEAIEATCPRDALSVTLPFGLGTFELRRVGADSLGGERVLAGDTASLGLARDRGPVPRRVELTIERDGARLPGVLVLPPGPGPHPGVVLLHGSAPMGRANWEYRSWADLYARRGVAALYYDRRGLDASGDTITAPSFDALAEDALAAVDSLRTRPEIDPKRIGLSGGSQAGWVGLLAAARSADVAFLVLRSAPAVTPAEQEEQSVAHRLRRAGLSEDEVQEAVAHTRLFFYVVGTDRGWDELASSTARAREASWGDAVQQPRSPGDLAWWRAHHDFRPLPLIRALDVPTLLLYGEEDPIVPPALNAPIFGAAVPDSTPVQVEVFPFANHTLEIGAGRVEGEAWRFPHRPDRMFDVLDRWLADHVTAGDTPESASAFEKHLERIVPALLDSTGVPGAAVGMVADGRVVGLRGFGVTDRGGGSPVGPRTVFNVGSISKTVTAWGVMRLVEAGRVDLDAPANRYLERWEVRSDSLPAEEVTVRRLLAHTSGLSLAAVPEYGPDDPLPSLVEALADPAIGPLLGAAPGSAYRYSGGGYMVLQLLIEEVTGRSFDAFIREEVLHPLGMETSGLGWPPALRASAATPYENGEPVPYHRYLGEGAAGLATTVEDLTRLAVASLENGTPGNAGDARGAAVIDGAGNLRPETIALMRSPQPGTEQLGGAIRGGLGYALWRLADGSWSAGHAGQNTGWAAVLWLVPGTGDGLVVLTNASSGRSVWRWVLCDWAGWVADTRWRGLCSDRPAWLPDPPAPRAAGSDTTSSAPRLPAIDALVRELIQPGEPGAALLVRHAGEVVHRAGYGRTAPDSGAALDVDTPFYLASVAKPLTATAVLALVEEGELELGDRVGDFVDGLPAAAGDVTVHQLLTHTSGIPDYLGFVEWARLGLLDNAAVLDTLRRGGAPRFEPGSRHEYSNSNYVLLAAMAERATGRRFEDLLEATVLERSGMRATRLLDEVADSVPGRALGWAPDSLRGFRLVDYRRIDLGGFEAPLGLATVGAGGVVATAADLDRFARALFRGGLVGDSLRLAATSVQAPVEAPNGTIAELDGYGYGWYVSRRYGSEVLWHDGDFGGFRTLLLHVPGHAFTLTLLANRADLDQRALAVRIADRLLGGTRPGTHGT